MEADLEKARWGDREAMARLVEAHYASVYRFCAHRLGPDLAADAAQETFVTATQRLHTFRGEAGLSTWLFGIAHNHCRNLSRRKRIETVDWLSESGPQHNPEGSLIDRQALRAALRRLSEEHREVVLLHEVEGLAYEEISQVLGVPVGTVKSRLHHAFLNLRRSLMGEVPA